MGSVASYKYISTKPNMLFLFSSMCSLLSKKPFPIIWGATWDNVPSDMCDQRRLKSACASVYTYQSFRCPHEEILRPRLSKMRLGKILIRLCECAGWSESLLGADVRRYVFWRNGLFISTVYHYMVDIHESCCVTFKTAKIHISLRRGGSNEYPQSMFLSRNKKNNVYPCKPQFYYVKVGFKCQNYIGMFLWC